MKFLNLKVENFMVIAEASVDLDSRGLVLIDVVFVRGNSHWIQGR